MALFERLRSWMQRRSARLAQQRHRQWRRQLYPDFCVTSLEQRRVFNAAPVISPQTFDVDDNASNGQPIAVVQAFDSDVGDHLTFAITAGNTSGAFALNASTGQLSVANPGPLGSETDFALTIRVTDPAGLHSSATITINVNPSNPGNARPTVNDQRFVIPLASTNGTVVGSVVATDGDPADSLTWSITAGNDSGAFAIDPATGEITVADATQLTIADTLSLTVEVEDEDAVTDQATILIQLNEAPSNAALSNDTVSENSAGAIIGTVSVTDNNADDQFTVTVSDTRFEVVGGALKLKSGQSLDYEAAATVPVTLTFTDAGGETYEEQFTIHVTDVNEAPTAVHLASTTVAENSAGATIGTVSVTDPDQSNTPFGTHSFEVLEDYGSGFVTSTRFEVAANQLRLKSGIALDHETAASVVVRIRATDGGTASIEDEFSITVTDVNEPVSSITLGATVVAENAAGATIGSVSANDPDDPSQPFGTLTWTVQEDYGSGYVTSTRFEIVGGQLRLKAGVALNHETEPSADIRIRTADGGGLSYQDDFTITVSDVNEAPTSIGLSNTTVQENATGAAIGSVTVTDPDDPAEPFGTHTLVVQEDYGAGYVTSTRFEIVGGQLRLKAGIALNHESEPTADIRIRATDGGGLSYQDDFTVTVSDVNEAPTSIGLSNSTVQENATGAVIGSVTVTDPDDPAEPFGTHTLVVQEDYGSGYVTSTRFEIVGGQLRLKAGVALNQETEPTADIRIRATDGGGLSYQDDFTITVSDVNEAPTSIGLSNTTLQENATGAVIGSVTVTDPDDPAEPFGTHTLVVQEDYGSGYVTSTRFEIVGGQLRLKAGIALNHEAESTVTVRIRATDGGGLSTQDDFVLTVTDVNEAPTAIDLSNQTVAEDSPGAIIGNVAVTDPDDPAEPFGTHTFLVQEDYGSGFVTSTRFEVVGGQLKLKAGIFLDRETEPSVLVRIRATDGGGLAVTRDVTIDVDDVNEPPTAIALGNQSVAENATAAVVGAVTVTDADDPSEPFGTHTFLVQEDYGSGFVISTRFEVVGGQLRLKAGVSLNHENEASALVRVSATDGGGESIQQDFTITITDVNEAPTGIALSNQTVAENDAGAVIGTITVTDPDNPVEPFGTHTLVVQENYGSGFVTSTRFTIVGNELRLLPGVSLNHEVDPTVTVRIRATDGGGLVLASNFTVTVTDVNEPPTAILLSDTSILENVPGGVVATVTVVDPDNPSEPFGTHDIVVLEDYGGGYVVSTRFEVSGGVLRLKAGVELDHETEPAVSIRLTATDTPGLSITEDFVITVTNVNESPVAVTNEYATTEDDSTAGDVLLDDTGAGVDSDVDGDTLFVSAVNGNGALVGQSFTLASGATLRVNANGTFTYDPTTSATFQAMQTGELAIETFTYTASDGNGGTDIATVTLRVTGVNDQPLVAGSANAAGTEDTPRSFTHAQLLALLSATDVDDLPQNLEILISNVQNAVYVAGNSSGALYTFTPLLDFNGQVTFTYQVRDDELAVSNEGTGTITISPVNDPPTLSIGPLVVNEDSVTPLPAALTSGFMDVETLASAATFEVLSTSSHITASIDPVTKVLTISTTTANYNGPASVVIRVTDAGEGASAPLSATQTVAVSVAPVNDPPTVVNESQNLAEDPAIAVGGNLRTNDSDVDADPLLNQAGALNNILANGYSAHPSMTVNPDSTYRLAQGGTLALNANGTYTYMPAADFFGTETFVYRVTDSLGGVGVGTLTLHVAPVNDPPRLTSPPTIELDPANPTAILITNVVPGPANEADQQLTFSSSFNISGVLAPPSITPHPTLAQTWVVQFANIPFENQDLVLTLVATDNGPPPGNNRLERVIPLRIVVSQIPVDTTPMVATPPPEFPVFPVTQSYIPPPAAPTLPIAPLLIAASGADSGTQGQRVVEVYLVPADGNTEQLGTPMLVLPPELLNDLKRLFRELPDDRYRIYLRMEDGTRKEVLDVYVRDGRPFDPGETDSELVIPAPAEATTLEPLGERPPHDELPVDDAAAEPAADAAGPDLIPPAAQSPLPDNAQRDVTRAMFAGSGALVLVTRGESRRRVQRALAELARRSPHYASHPSTDVH